MPKGMGYAKKGNHIPKGKYFHRPKAKRNGVVLMKRPHRPKEQGN